MAPPKKASGKKPGKAVAVRVSGAKRTPASEELVLEALRKGCSVAKAAEYAGINRTTAFRWRRESKAAAKLRDEGKAYPKDINVDFDAEWEDAVQAGYDRMEDEAWRRAVDGYAEPVIHQGQMCYAVNPETGEMLKGPDGQPIPLAVRKYSDNLLIMMLKGVRRDKYGDSKSASMKLSQDEETGTKTIEIEFVD